MAIIKTYNGMDVLVDNVDHDSLAQYRWKAVRCNPSRGYAMYAACSMRLATGKFTTALMHRYLLKAPKGMTVDHINGNGLDNRRENLRLATVSQNKANCPGQRQRKPGSLKGAYPLGSRWQSAIKINNKRHWLGHFKTQQEAHAAWWGAAQIAFGEFARKE